MFILCFLSKPHSPQLLEFSLILWHKYKIQTFCPEWLDYMSRKHEMKQSGVNSDMLRCRTGFWFDRTPLSKNKVTHWKCDTFAFFDAVPWDLTWRLTIRRSDVCGLSDVLPQVRLDRPVCHMQPPPSCHDLHSAIRCCNVREIHHLTPLCRGQ